MLTTKNAGRVAGVKVERNIFKRRAARPFTFSAWIVFLTGLVLTATLTGCGPPGPKALLEGQALIERGQYAEAIERLKTATSLLSTNAQAWNYLGLAYHQAGQPNDAADAYKKAMALDQNLVEVHYNLGCLWLEQNRPDLAKAELTAYTMHRGEKSPDAWIKLGEAQLALRDVAGAEKSLNQARLLDAQNPEALNDMGVVQMQRNRPTEAAQYFNAAIRAKPDYGPAILNLAIVSQNLNNRQYALQRYQEYLALKPRPANWEAVDAAARALAQELTSTPVAPLVAARAPAPTNSVPQSSARPANNTPRTGSLKNEQPAPVNPRSSGQGTAAPVEVVQVAPEPVIRGVAESSAAEPGGSSNPVAESPKADHRGFFSRVNPANLFKGGRTDQPTVITAHSTTNAATVTVATPEPPKPIVYPRYTYRVVKKPANGDRTAAQKASVDGSTAQQARQFPEAAAASKRATQADPGYFDAYYNLGVVSFQSGNLPQAISAYETALMIQPDSHDARFNFALALKQANYPVDAANELEKVLAKSPADTYAHYALANLYAQQLRQPAKAREHYQKILELNPAFSQAAAIHDWLWANPR
jgi:tetratricopeptide (TPR) repeat protein